MLVPANSTTITSKVINTMKSVNTHKKRDDSVLTVRKRCVACEIWVNSQGKMSPLTEWFGPMWQQECSSAEGEGGAGV